MVTIPIVVVQRGILAAGGTDMEHTGTGDVLRHRFIGEHMVNQLRRRVITVRESTRVILEYLFLETGILDDRDRVLSLLTVQIAQDQNIGISGFRFQCVNQIIRILLAVAVSCVFRRVLRFEMVHGQRETLLCSQLFECLDTLRVLVIQRSRYGVVTTVRFHFVFAINKT